MEEEYRDVDLGEVRYVRSLTASILHLCEQILARTKELGTYLFVTDELAEGFAEMAEDLAGLQALIHQREMNGRQLYAVKIFWPDERTEEWKIVHATELHAP